jgi:hypothetical protein
MSAVISTAGATEIVHAGTTYVADPSGVFDMPDEVVAEIGKLHNLVNAAEHTASVKAAELAEEMKPESLHARLVAVEEVLAGVETHLAAKVEEAVAKIEAAAKTTEAKTAKPKAAKTAAPAKTTEPPAS